MANDLQAMITRIAAETTRTELAANNGGAITSSIAQAIYTAIDAYQKQRFEFSDVDPAAPPTFNTVVGRQIYDEADNAAIRTAYRFDYLNCTIGSTVEMMQRRTPEEIILLTQNGTESGQPTDWAYQGHKIMVWPIPAAVWTLTLGGHLKVLAPAALDEAANYWMVEGEKLIRCRAKYELYTHVLRDVAKASQFNPDTGESNLAFRELKGASNKKVGRGYMRAMRF